MRKVKLQVDELAVESFQTTPAGGFGTVLGRMDADGAVAPYPGAGTYPECPSPLCQDTPLASCNGSCQPGCVPAETDDCGTAA